MEFTQEVQKATDPIYQKISKVMPEIEWSVHAPYVHKINCLLYTSPSPRDLSTSRMPSSA